MCIQKYCVCVSESESLVCPAAPRGHNPKDPGTTNFFIHLQSFKKFVNNLL